MKEKNGEHPLGDAGQLIAAGAFLLIWTVDSFILRLSTFLSGHVPLLLRLVILVLAVATAFVLLGSGHVVVRRDRQPSGVVTTGAFRWVRHPMYLASLLTYLGLSIATLSLLSLALSAVIFVFYDFIAGYEERLLEARYKDVYRAYRDRTGKWIPRIGSKR